MNIICLLPILGIALGLALPDDRAQKSTFRPEKTIQQEA
jgi:hypothetical protein